VGRASGLKHAPRRRSRSPPSHPHSPPFLTHAQDKAGAGDPKIAALATEAAIGAPSSSSPSDESATSFCLGRRGLVTGAVLTTATLLILLLISRHTGDGAFEAAGLAPRRAGPP